ncbi:MAG: recombination protein RecR [Chloroflexi bacterium]|nr:recombination protein RecR [Chloroflexota bacterium]MBI3734769.1 recombination protein RecR [Chloroflexota bacterium]
MNSIPPSVTRLIDEFSRLPGIGPKTASRLTYYLLRMPDEQAKSLAAALSDLKEKTVTCQVCFNIAERSPCATCADEARDHSLICVVEEPLDVMAIERTREFKGTYHVLGGAINPIEGILPEDLKIAELVARVKREDIHEVILATNPNLEGESTAAYIQRQLAPHTRKVTRLARGLPIGGDLEYADEVTLMRAIEGRREM